MNKRYTLLAVTFLFTTSVFAANVKPVKVFILAGQSNMDGQADIRTIDFLGEDKDPARAALLKTFKPDGKTFVTRDDVWVASRGYHNLRTGLGGGGKDYSKPGSCIGPEYAFGYYMGEALENQVLLIKYAPGGQSLYVNFRPPSAGKTGNEKLDNEVLTKEVADKWNEGRVEPVVGLQYRNMVRCVHETLNNLKSKFPGYDEKAGYEIVGFVWFQGFNDMIEGGKPVAEYGKNLTCLIKDLRAEFKVPDMKVVVGVMGVNGLLNETGKQGDIRNHMRSMNTTPEFKGTVRAIETAPLLHPDVVALQTAGWLNKERDLKKNPMTPEEKAMLGRATSNKGFHYYGEGRFFILLGKAFADTMLELTGQGDKVLPPKLNDFAPTK
jgi:alpha-galactosidase